MFLKFKRGKRGKEKAFKGREVAGEHRKVYNNDFDNVFALLINSHCKLYVT